MTTPTANWFEDFFKGAALKVWRDAISDEETEAELEFLCEALSISEGDTILDLPCGNGRLTLPLAQAGFKMTGVDFSNAFIEEAKSKSTSADSDITYLESDVRKINFQGNFDGALCMGNSFGYFDAQGTSDFFRAVCKSLKPGAKFVLDTLMVAETFLVNGGEREWVQVSDIYMLIENEYNSRHSCVETTYTFIDNGQTEIHRSVHWIYTAGEICRLMEQSGFSVDDLYSSVDFEPFQLGSERLLLVATKN